MFLIECLAVVCVVYWVSVFVAEIVFDSKEELQLPLVIRTGFGFFFSIFYFAAFWQILSIGNTWILGVGVLLTYAYSRHYKNFFSGFFRKIYTNFPEHAKYLAVFMTGAGIFFSPLIISGNFGPFSEGGGDVSIYADVSRVLTDKNSTEYGTSGHWGGVIDNFREIYALNFDQATIESNITERHKRAPAPSLDVSLAEGAANRVVVFQSMSSFLYVPYAQYNFLALQTNYHVYYGIQAFLYCLVLVAMWFSFVAFGKKIAVGAVLIVLLSNGVISVFYNMYGAQAISIAFSALVLSSWRQIALNSWAGLRIYGAAVAYIGTIYVHFLTVVLPLIALSFKGKSGEGRAEPENIGVTFAGGNVFARIGRLVALFTYASIFALLLAGGARKSFVFFNALLTGVLSSANVYMGDRISMMSFKALSFLFGSMSQQHYLPLASEHSWLNGIVTLNAVAGIFCAVLGCVTVFKLNKMRYFVEEKRPYLYLYAALAFISVIHVVAAQSSLYTQAKGSQNVLLYVCAFMYVPYAAVATFGGANATVGRLSKALFVGLIVFTLTLSAPRIFFVYRIAFGMDRAAILESSFFPAAESIRAKDSESIVLFEPRKSADLYLSSQPFFGSRLLPTRHLVLQQLGDTLLVDPRRVTMADILVESDTPHLWTLRAIPIVRWSIFRFLGPSYKWEATKLDSTGKTSILLFGDDYQRNFGERDLGSFSDGKAQFSYIRNGAAMMYIPAGTTGELQVILEPRDSKNYVDLVESIDQQVKKGEISANVSILKDGRFVIVTSTISEQNSSNLKTIARYGNEYWISIKFNNVPL